MTLSGGTRLGPYEIIAAVGAGGMGEVYRARDTRLERTVAVKVLPSHLSASAEVRQRFEREAKTISQLSHPHICALYDVGNQDGVEFLVMEYLEGETLSDRLVKGPLAFDQVLRYGLEIADALGKAHRQGIVHRDLKPGNVMITKSGVKLLDFGLAKAVAPAAARSGASLTALPTQAGRDLTAEGTILGTFQYMAPEQLEGRDADARTDIFAFGCVLYEMATGRKAFSGKSQASLISSIMGSEPAPISAIAPMAPPAFDRVVRTCLAKDPDDRWQTAHDIAVQLKWIQEGGPATGIPAPVVAGRLKPRERIAWALAAVLAAALGVSLTRDFSRSPALPKAIRFQIPPPEGTEFARTPQANSLALSPDGTNLAFIAVKGGRTSLWLRRLDALVPIELKGTEGATSPFWSPDGRSIGFFAQSKLKRVEAAGGPPQELCDSTFGNSATWGPDGTILFTEFPGRKGVYRVSAQGGSPTLVASVEKTHGDRFARWPFFLPGGRRFLYSTGAFPGRGALTLAAGSLGSNEVRTIGPINSRVAYCPPERLLYVRDGTLLAQPFDADGLRVTGDPIPVNDDVWYFRGTGNAGFSVSASGSVASLPFRLPARLAWRDRSGREIGVVGMPAVFRDLRLSPDGSRIAVTIADPRVGTRDIWIYEGPQGLVRRFTADPVDAIFPVWSPAGDRIIYGSARETPVDIYVKSVGGSGDEQLVTNEIGVKLPMDWSPDGSQIVYEDFSPARAPQRQLWVLPLTGERKATPLLRSPFTARDARFSPRGDWIAFVSEESGRQEVYVVAASGAGETRRISPSGGAFPRWRRDGSELFYLAANGDLISVAIHVGGGGFVTGPSSTLFNANPPPSDFDVSPDGRRFLFQEGVRGDAPVTVVVNWAAEVKK
jgi:Tol biopolymer transport system component